MTKLGKDYGLARTGTEYHVSTHWKSLMMDEAFFTKVDVMTYFLDKSTAMLTQQIHEVSGHEGCTGS